VIAPLFLTCAGRAADAIASPEVAAAWDAGSALEGYAVAGLAGHLARAVLTVETYLDRAPDGVEDDAGALTDASGYLVAVLGEEDPVSSDLHRGVRLRGAQTAADGPSALAAAVRDTVARLGGRLDEATLGRPLRGPRRGHVDRRRLPAHPARRTRRAPRRPRRERRTVVRRHAARRGVRRGGRRAGAGRRPPPRRARHGPVAPRVANGTRRRSGRCSRGPVGRTGTVYAPGISRGGTWTTTPGRRRT
jgi:hypothetical protein